MSLLLDALKKAAQENQNSGAADAIQETDRVMQVLSDDALFLDNGATDAQPEQLDELELDVDALAYAATDDEAAPLESDKCADIPAEDHEITPTPSTVTDEALQLLIHKTNHSHRRSRVLVWGGIVASSLIVLSGGGLYFYFDMITEMEQMQRKHQIALAALRSKTRIEENLTSLADMPEREPKRQQVQAASRTDKPGATRRIVGGATADNKKPEQTFSVQKASRRDPVSESLQRAWTAYHEGDYAVSRLEYNNVLDNEPKNHDALLGLAAVSLQQNDIDSARDIYIQLLELDPRDTHAHAGLANIAQKHGGELNEARLKQLIEHRPDSAHLQFALGNLYTQKKSWPEAQQAFFNAWKADSQNPDYAYNLAVSLDHLGKHEVAMAYYQDSLELAAGKNVNFSVDAVKTRLSSIIASQ